MNTRTTAMVSIAMVASLVAFGLSAKTVALWPMEYDESHQAPNMRCAISSANGFTYLNQASAFEEETVGWNLPPNPDTFASPLFSMVSRQAFDNNGQIFRVDSAEISELVNLTHDFTIEGWIKPRNVKDANWRIIMQSNGGTDFLNTWSWTIRNTVGGQPSNVNFQTYVTGYQGDCTMGAALTEEEEVSLTNSWHHIALVFRVDNGEGLNQFTFYFDGVEHGKSTAFGPVPKTDFEKTYQEFGGRPAGVDYNPVFVANGLEARWDYWRLTDEALSPGNFLNFGGSGTVVPKEDDPVPEQTKTVGYWKLGADADGYISGHDFVGGFELSRGLLDNNGTEIEAMGLSSAIAASKDKPFVQPPNTTAAIPGGLRGSFRASETYSHVLIPGVGPQLELDNDFTVEAYVRFLENEGFKDRYPNSDCYLFGNARGRGSNRWVLRMGFNDNPRKLTLMVYDYINNVWAAGGDFCTVPDDTAWHHLAMVYEGTPNARTWTLYIDGQAKGSVNYPQDVPSDPYASYLMLFGRGGPDAFPGEMACVRVCKAKLSMKQFLCESADPQAATDVIGYWPLDTKDGVTLDGRDVATGAYSFTHGAYDGDDYKISSVADDQPVITNPENKVGVYAKDGTTRGAVQFRNGNIGKKSFLFHRASDLVAHVQGKEKEWTFEFYTKRNSEPQIGTPGEIILLMPGGAGGRFDEDPDYYSNWSEFMVAYGTRGFTVYDKSVAAFRTDYPHVDTAVCDGTVGAIPIGEWAHVAVTRSVAEGSVTYAFFVDGVEKGSMKGMIDGDNEGSCMFFGGCRNFWGQECAWCGLWSSLRISKGILSPSEFLNASPLSPTPTPVAETLAYWPFDFRNGLLDLGSRSLYQYAPWNLIPGSVAGSGERAVHRIENPATDLPLPNARNYGSASIVRGSVLTYPGLAQKLSYDRAFTVEGWINWAQSVTAKDEVIFGACGLANVAHGWRVYVDYSEGVPKLKIHAKASNADYGAVVGGTLVDDMSPWSGVWKHLSIVYNPAVGQFGTWKCYVDGALVTVLNNAWYPGLGAWLQSDFVIGGAETANATGFTGLIDEWRVVTKALSQEELLKEAERRGFAVSIR